MSKQKQLNRTALYMRLSRDDEKAGESMSIENQRIILKKYAEENSGTVVDEYIDDGWSGTDFDRPAIKRLLDDAKEGKIDTIVVKDLSRFGRNYIQVGQYIDYIFPAYGIRFIALADNVDTAERGSAGMDMMPIMNVFNEWHAANTSKKIRAVLEANWKQGKYTNWAYPYGYKAGTDEKRTAVIDEEAANIVRRIYDMRLAGSSYREIARALTDEGIPNPTAYYTRLDGRKSVRRNLGYWTTRTVSEILSNPTYTGRMTQHLTTRFSYKNHKVLNVPESEHVVKENAHAAIVDRATWEKVQALKAGTRRKRPTVTQEPSVFSGYLKCPECGGNLNFHFNQGNHDIKFFSCQNHNSGLRKCSSTHYIRLDFLEQVVLYEIHRLACFANEYENDFIKAMVGRSAKVAENDRIRKKRELDGLLARDGELDMLFERLYEDNVSGKIDDARFAKMSKRYEQEQGENAKKIKALRLELKKLEDKRMDVDTFLETVRRYTDATTITKRMVAELIQYIEVYPAVKEDGITNQRVTIHYNCIGAFEVPDRRKIPERDILLETRKGVALSYAPAV